MLLSSSPARLRRRMPLSMTGTNSQQNQERHTPYCLVSGVGHQSCLFSKARLEARLKWVYISSRKAKNYASMSQCFSILHFLNFCSCYIVMLYRQPVYIRSFVCERVYMYRARTQKRHKGVNETSLKGWDGVLAGFFYGFNYT